MSIITESALSYLAINISCPGRDGRDGIPGSPGSPGRDGAQGLQGQSHKIILGTSNKFRRFCDIYF